MSTSNAFSITITDPSNQSTLSSVANALAVGQYAQFDSNIPTSALLYPGEAFNFIQWGSSCYYDPARREIGYIGKIASTFPFHWLVYDEINGTWSNSRGVWSTASVSGHGYDHNAFDPATGYVYHRRGNLVYVWDGASWGQLPTMPVSPSVAGGLTWVPGKGLFYNSGVHFLQYTGGAWVNRSSELTNDVASYHDVSEYNSTSGALIFGGGNSNPFWIMNSAGVVSQIQSPPFTVGASASHALLMSDPNSAYVIAYDRANTGAWIRFNTSNPAGSWESATGVPMYSGSANCSSVACAIPASGVFNHGVIVIIETPSLTTTGRGWVWRYS